MALSSGPILSDLSVTESEVQGNETKSNRFSINGWIRRQYRRFFIQYPLEGYGAGRGTEALALPVQNLSSR